MKNKTMYVVYKKDYIERFGELIEDEINIGDSDSVMGLVRYLKSKDINIAKRTIYKAINTKKPIHDTYFIYKIKV